MAGNTATLQIRIQVDSNGNIVLTNLNQGLEQTARSGQQAAGGISAMERQMGRLVAVVGSYLSLQTAKSILTLADHYNTVVGRVKLYTDSIAETKAVEEQLYKQSQLTGTSMNTNVQFFARLSAAAKPYNLSLKDRLELEDTLNKTMILSGVTSSESASILLQFSQALSKGKLDGDEFRSMAENNVVWTAKLAEQLGVTKGELLNMSATGQLTVDTLFKAMKGMTESVGQEFDKLPVSIDRAYQEMINAFEYAIAGGGNAADGVSRIAAGMEGLAATIQANTPAIQTLFEIIVTGADISIRGVSALVATIESVSAVANGTAGAIFQLISAAASLTDQVGLTSNAASEWKLNSDAAFASAEDLARKADANFKQAFQSTNDAKKASEDYKNSLGGTSQALIDQLDAHKKLETGAIESTEKISAASKKVQQEEDKWLKQHYKEVENLYKKTGALAEEYYDQQAQKTLEQAEHWRELGVDEVTVQQQAYDELNDIAQKAYEDGNVAAGKYFTGLTAQFTLASRSITSEQAKLLEKFEEINGYEITIDDTTDWEEIKNNVEDAKHVVTDAQEEIITKFESLSGLTLEIDDKTDWAGLRADIKAMEEEEKKLDKTAKIDADTANADKKIAKSKEKADELDKKKSTVKIDADTSSIDSALSEVEKKAKSAGSMISEAMGGVGGAIALTADALASSSVLLDPFGDMRKSAEAAKRSINEIQGAESSLEQMLLGLGADIDPFGELASKYGEQLQTMRDDSTTTIDDVKKLQTEAIKEVSRAQDDARKEYLSGQKDMVSEQLDSAQEALNYMQDYQKAYYDYMLDNANDYYEELKQQRDDAVEAEKEAAEERYKAEEELLEKKLALAEKEADANNKKLSALREIYQEAGVGGEEYYQLEQQKLAEQAQEWQNQGIDRVYIERWLQDELSDLRKKANDEGIRGLKSYEDAIISSYETTGNFSQETVDAENKVASLKEQLERLKEAGTEAFFNESSIAAQGFDEKIQAAEGNINSLQAQIDALNGKNFDFVGKSTDYFSNAVANATANVANLKGQLSSLDSQLNSIRQNQENVSTSGTTSSSTSTTSSGWFDEALKKGFGVWSFTGGGYTWDGPRSGGVDGLNGQPVLLHSQETVIDHLNPDRSAISSLYNKFVAGQGGSGVDNSVKIQQLTVQVSQVSNLDTDTIIANIKRKLMRA